MNMNEMRASVIDIMKKSNPEVFEQAKANRAIGSLFPNKRPVQKTNIKEEFFMGRTLPPRKDGNTNAEVNVQNTQVSTGIISTDTLSKAVYKSITFKPKAIIVDKDRAKKMVTDVTLDDIKNQKTIFESQEKNQIMTDNGPGVKNYPVIRLLRDTCLATKKNPLDFAEIGADGKVVTEEHKPVVQGFVITFPQSEGVGEVTSIVKKSNFVNEIIDRGGSYIVGDVDEPKLDKAKYEIPVIIKVTPFVRKKKDGEAVLTNRISGHLSAVREKEWFPKGSDISMYSIFDKFPVEGYSLGRVIPRNIHETVEVSGERIAVVDLELDKAEKDRSKLPKYAVKSNSLTAGTPGAEIAAALNITSEALAAAFKRNSATSNDSELVSTNDFIASLLNDARTKKSEYNQLLAESLQANA